MKCTLHGLSAGIITVLTLYILYKEVVQILVRPVEDTHKTYSNVKSNEVMSLSLSTGTRLSILSTAYNHRD